MPAKKTSAFHLSLFVFKLEASRGHKKWSVTELAKLSDTSRPTIYRTLGSSKDEILETCVNEFTSHFYELSADSRMTLGEQLKFGRKQLQKFSEAIVFYQKWRSRKGWIYDLFLEKEKIYQKNLQKRFPVLDARGARVVHAIFHGFVTAPFLSPEQVEDAAAYLIEKTDLGKLPG